MCSIAAGTLALSAIGTLSQASGQAQQGQAAQSSAAFNAQVQSNNAIIARQQAVQAHDIGKVESAKGQLRARQLIGLQRSSLAGSGVRVGTGSAADLISDTRAQAGVDAATTRSNAAREALGFLTQGTNFDAQAGVSLAEGSNAASAANLAVGSTILGGAATVASKWQSFRNVGIQPFGAF